MKKYLIILTVCFLGILPLSAHAALTTNVVSYWKLDGNSNDASSTNNGTDHTISYNTTYGKINQGALFDGSSSYIQTADAYEYSGLSTMTITAWVKLTDAGNDVIFTKGTYVSSLYHWSYLFAVDGGYDSLTIYPYDGDGTTVIFADNTKLVNDGNWHFVAVSFQGSTAVNFYVDGINVKTLTTSVPANSAVNTYTGSIGSDNNSQFAKSYYKGDIDEVGLWSRVLSGAEITQLYNAGCGLQYTFGGATCGGSSNPSLLKINQGTLKINSGNLYVK